MCGQVGVAGNITEDLKEAFLSLLYIDVVRGADGTGMALYHTKHQKVRVIKAAVPSFQFLQLAKVAKAIPSITTCEVVMGHNRAATKGTIKDSNSHPFEFGNITLAHNGTLYGEGDLKCTGQEVDSANIAHNMSQHGEKVTLEGLRGAFSLVWINKDAGTLNFARNLQRPLCVASILEGDKTIALLWSSEKRMLKYVLEGANISSYRIWQPKPNFWFKIDASTLEMTVEEFKEYVYVWKGNKFFNRRPERDLYEDYDWDNFTHHAASDHEEGALTLINKNKGLETDLMPDNFTPYKQDDNTGIIRGWLYSDRIGGRVEGIVYGAARRYNVQKWTKCKVVGATFVGKSTPCAICEFIPAFDQTFGWNMEEFTTPYAFYRATSKGCLTCKKTPHMSDAHTLKWVGPDRFFCERCTPLAITHDKKEANTDNFIVRAKALVAKYSGEAQK